MTKKNQKKQKRPKRQKKQKKQKIQKKQKRPKKQKIYKRKRRRFYKNKTLTKKEIRIKYKEILLEIIPEFDKYTTGRKNKCNIEEYVDGILNVFFNGFKWIQLNDFSHKVDESAIRQKFYKWRDLGIFDEANARMASIYYKYKSFKNLFIDSTVIENKNCSDKAIGFYFKIKSKKMLKLNIISDKNQVPLAWEITKPGVHDSIMIKPLIKKLNVKLRQNCKLIGDKGYIIKHVFVSKNKKKIKVMFPYKQNQKKSVTKKRIILLSKRFAIEGANSSLKHTYSRLEKVNDRNLINYSTFVTMAVTCQMIRNIYKYRLA